MTQFPSTNSNLLTNPKERRDRENNVCERYHCKRRLSIYPPDTILLYVIWLWSHSNTNQCLVGFAVITKSFPTSWRCDYHYEKTGPKIGYGDGFILSMPLIYNGPTNHVQADSVWQTCRVHRKRGKAAIFEFRGTGRCQVSVCRSVRPDSWCAGGSQMNHTRLPGLPNQRSSIS